MTRGMVLEKAMQVINGDRQDQYGNPEDSFQVISDFWAVYLKHNRIVSQSPASLGLISKKDVALMMALMKIAREMYGAGKEDNMIDAAGYIGLAADMSNYKESNNG